MTIGIIDRLLGRWRDPTKDWRVEVGASPDFDLSRMAFGSLRLGDPIEAARFLGRPDSFRWKKDGYCELLYARAGFQLDFQGGHLCYVAFFVGVDTYQPTHPTLSLSQPQIRGGIRLTQRTGREELLRYFGRPVSEDCDSDETILYYLRGGVTMEFELDGSGHLKRWNLYPSDDAALHPPWRM
jgi:hypothetical protein